MNTTEVKNRWSKAKLIIVSIVCLFFSYAILSTVTPVKSCVASVLTLKPSTLTAFAQHKREICRFFSFFPSCS